MNNMTPRCYLTLRCNLACAFCSNGHDIAKYREMTAGEWISHIAFFGTRDVVFTGGEPTLHKDFYQVINGLARTHEMTVYTNCKESLATSMLPCTPRLLTFRCSCHAQTVEEAAKWIEHVTAIRGGGYRVFWTTVHCPPAVLDVLKPHGITVDEPQYAPEAMDAPVKCHLPRRLVAPDGKRYHCVGKLVKGDPSGRVPYNSVDTVQCDTPGLCAACDSLSAERSAM